MSDIIEDYLRRVDAALPGDAERRAHVVREMRAHLTEKGDDLARADPSASRDEIDRRVVDDFGDPRDLALAYHDGDAVLRNRTTGEVVLELSRDAGRALRTAGKAAGPAVRAVGRGAGLVLKVAAIAVAVILVIAIGVGLWAYYEFKPILERNVPVPVFESRESCPEECNLTRDLSFYVQPGVREVRFDLDVHHRDPSLGVALVSLRDANGTLVYEESFPANGTHSSTVHQALAPVAGNWTVNLEYVAFQGWLDLEVLTVGLPDGAMP